MKIFDFTHGYKGKELAEIKQANAMHGWLVRKGDKVFRVELCWSAQRGFGPDTEATWHTGATWLRWENDEPVEDMPILPEDFGVDAICFCTGNWKTGPGAGKWVWTVLGTTEWNREACRKGILKASYERTVTDDAK